MPASDQPAIARPTARARPARDRRAEILDAALSCFAARGIDATTIADIRERAGATTGSIYHFFAGKDGIVGALYVDALRAYQVSLLDHLARARSGRGAVRGIVEHYLDWVGRHPQAARFLFEARRWPAVAAVEADIRAGNRDLLRGVRAQLDRVGLATARALPPDLLIAVVIGPAMTWAREHLAGHAASDLRRARRVLADSAWAALARYAEETS